MGGWFAGRAWNEHLALNDFARFDASDDKMTTTFVLSSAPATFFVVYAHQTGTGGKRVLAGTNNWLVGPYSSQYTFYNDNFGVNALPTLTGRFVVETLRQQTGLTEHWTNGILRASFAATGVLPGTFGLGNIVGEPAGSAVAEVIIYNTVVAESDRKKVEAYLEQKYGLI